MATHSITVTVNGAKERLDVPSNMTLLQMLREQLGLTGTKNGCEAGECGACTVLVAGEPVNSCMMLAVEADGQEILSVEGLAPEGTLSVNVVLGTIKVTVPPGVRVEVVGTSVLGTRKIDESQGAVSAGAPVLRLKLDTVVGTVKVYRR